MYSKMPEILELSPRFKFVPLSRVNAWCQTWLQCLPLFSAPHVCGFNVIPNVQYDLKTAYTSRKIERKHGYIFQNLL